MNEQILDAVSWTLIHSFWQAALVAIVLAIILPAIRRHKYTVSIAALACLILVCGFTFTKHYQWPTDEIALQIPTANDASGLDPLPSDLSVETIVSTDQSSSAVLETHAYDDHQHLATASQSKSSWIQSLLLANWQRWLVVAWLIGTGAQLLKVFISWLGLNRIHRNSDPISTKPILAKRLAALETRLGLRKPIRWLLSKSIDVPMVSGVVRPIVVVPTSMMTGMTPEQIDAILLHELAHVRRHDFLVNLLQMLVETLLFFNPAVWWISKQIRIQREYSCDDLACSAFGDKREYAWALAALEQLRATPTLAMAANGGKSGSLLDRVNRLVGAAQPSRRISGFTSVLLTLLTVAVIGVVSTWAVAGPPGEEPELTQNQEQIRDVIGGFDADYWKVVDVPKLLKDKQVAFSPDKNWLALVRDKQLYVIESETRKVQQQRQLNLQSATLQWKSNEQLLIKDDTDVSLLVKKQFIKVVTSAGQDASINAVTTAFVGYPYKKRDGWGASRNRDGLVSLAGLPAGTHRLVLAPSSPERNVTEITLPLPKSDIVIQRKLVAPTDWFSNNYHFVASSEQRDGETIVKVRIENRTGGPMRVSDYDLRLEVPGPNYTSHWGLSPVWRKELNREAKTVTVANGENGEFSFSWQEILRNGLWYGEGNFASDFSGPVIPPAPPGQTGLRVWFRNSGVLPINVVHPSKTTVAEADMGDDKNVAKQVEVNPSNNSVAQLTERLKSANADIRHVAAMRAGELMLRELLPELQTCLADDDKRVRQSAAKSLGQLGDPKAVKSLLPLSSDPVLSVRFAAVESLVLLGEKLRPEWIEPIIKSKDMSVWQNAAWLARRNGGNEAKYMLMRCLEFDDPSARNYYNYTLLWQIHACGGPDLKYHHDFDNEGDENQIASNRKTLAQMKTELNKGERLFGMGNVNTSEDARKIQTANAEKRKKDAATVRDYVMLQLRRYIIGAGKIETHRIKLAIDIVSSEGKDDPAVRKILLEELEKSHADKNGLRRRQRILEVIGQVFAQDGQQRWSHEYSKRPGAFVQQRPTPPAEVLYSKSSDLEAVVKLGRKATRSDIDYYVMALRNAHHPQTAGFLLDVINNPVPGPFDNSPAQGKWADNTGGGWRSAKLIAATGLAELGRAEGVEWLIEKTRPGSVEYTLAKKSTLVLHELSTNSKDQFQSGGQLPKKSFDDWTAWWQENKDRFMPNKARSIGTSVMSSPHW